MVRIRGHWNGELDLTRRVAWLIGEWGGTMLKWSNGALRSVDLPVTGKVVRNAAGGLSYQGFYDGDTPYYDSYTDAGDELLGFGFVIDEVDDSGFVLRELSLDRGVENLLWSRRDDLQNFMNRYLEPFKLVPTENALIRLTNKTGQALEYRVLGERIELQSASWQRDGVRHECTQGADGNWHYQLSELSGSQATRVVLQGEELAMLPDQSKGDVTLTLPVATQELVLDTAWTAAWPRVVNITPVAGLTVSLQGESSNLSWGRRGNDLVLLQGGQPKIRWSQLLSDASSEVLANTQLQIGGETHRLASIVIANYDLPRPAVAEGAAGQQAVEQLRQALSSLHTAGHSEGVVRVPSHNHTVPPLTPST
ncbi:hypothetical protein WK00_23315 [Burkholderia ubonensis]|nr:hypothetical protein WK00_23315 [Burkholderia ubonensis]